MDTGDVRLVEMMLEERLAGLRERIDRLEAQLSERAELLEVEPGTFRDEMLSEIARLRDEINSTRVPESETIEDIVEESTSEVEEEQIEAIEEVAESVEELEEVVEELVETVEEALEESEEESVEESVEEHLEPINENPETQPKRGFRWHRPILEKQEV